MSDTEPAMTQLSDDLLELKRAGALGGIREIIAVRLRDVREGWAPDERTPGLAAAWTCPRDVADAPPARARYAVAAAMLAALIDQEHDAGSTT
jgi:hypothetical protein